MLPSVAAKWFVPRMSRFQDRYPDIDLRITAGERLVDLAREGIDVAIRFGGGAWPGLHIEVLAAEAVTPLCSPALAATLHQPGDLAHATLLHEDWEPFDNFPSWQDWLAAAEVTGVDVRRGPRFSHSHMMLHAAIDGHGVALGQLVLARDDITAGRLAAPFPLCLPVGYAHYLVCLPSAAAKPKIKAFRDWIVAEMAQTVAESALAPQRAPTTAP
jgi:LysR family glycine cleavage system transcriptional activator